MRRSLVATALLAAVAAAPAARASDAPLRLDVEIIKGETVLDRASLVVGDGETAVADLRREIPYRQVASADEEDGEGPVVAVGHRVRVTPVVQDGKLKLDADIRLSSLTGYERVSAGERSVDIPQVSNERIEAVDAAMVPDGDGWRYESPTAADGLRVLIVARR